MFSVIVLTIIVVFASVSGFESPRIQNNLFRYGEFCGPGPDDSLWGIVQPVDHLDSLCQRHDFAYSVCLHEFSREYGARPPKHLNQIMPMRGLLPDFIRSIIYSQYRLSPSYRSCMHQADTEFVQALDDLYENERLPSWWSNPETAPKGAQGVSGYSEACAFGISSQGICIVPLKTLFRTLLEVFRLGVMSD